MSVSYGPQWLFKAVGRGCRGGHGGCVNRIGRWAAPWMEGREFSGAGWRCIQLTKERLTMRHGYLIDMDGVLYRGSEMIAGADQFVRELRRREIPFRFLTNNSQ